MRDISNIRFGRLVPKSIQYTKNNKRYWLCQCDCGQQTVVRQDQITIGKTTSCGCYMREVQLNNLAKRQIKKPPKEKFPKPIDEHRERWIQLKHEYPRIYRIWQSMKSRCYYSKNKFYHCYGGRGIQICEEWKSSFELFAIWALANGYKDNLSIDRIDVNGDYCPQNCRWATQKEQQNNKRKSPSRIA